MENLYMKFREELKDGKILNPNSPSLEECMKEAKRLGYNKWGTSIALSIYGYGILILTNDGEYFTSSHSTELLIKYGYKEHIIHNPNTITVDGVEYRYVYVSDKSVEDALKEENKRLLLCTLPGDRKYPYLCIDKDSIEKFKNKKDYSFIVYKYIAEIPLEETKKEMTLEEIEKELGYGIKIV